MALARMDRPIGTWLLMWPTLWGLWFAAEGFPGWHLFIVFTAGVFLTRSAGCVMNDIADRNFDGMVKRTQGRPLAQGTIDVPEAVMFMGALLFIALLLVLSTNLLTVGLAFVAAAIATIYPFMKRYTYMPQAILGVAFSCGIPMAFTATGSDIPLIAWLLVVANLIWTVAYDTEYAMVDRDDDLKLGLKSTAILFADLDRFMVGVLQALFLGVLWLIARNAELGTSFYWGLLGAAGLFCYQHWLIKDRDRDRCFKAFLNNHWVGCVIFIGIALHFWFVD
ncbi:MAG: 4-hydroxybenzoate octaprenyltransferase [Pseudomonadales bacterium]|nr:4-hydroxybenzoate octaprenyltransferase [Pseudomonadales bacterium]